MNRGQHWLCVLALLQQCNARYHIIVVDEPAVLAVICLAELSEAFGGPTREYQVRLDPNKGFVSTMPGTDFKFFSITQVSRDLRFIASYSGFVLRRV